MDVDAAIEMHDRLLDKAEVAAGHDPATCPMCLIKETASAHEPSGGHDMSYTEEELQAAVDKAVAEQTASLQERISELEGAAAESEVDARIAELTTAHDEKVAEVQSKLDAAVLEAQKEKDEREALETYLRDEAERIEQETAAAARKDERLAKVREVASFPDEYLEENADRFAAMSDEEFDKAVSDWTAISAKGDDGRRPPATTALHASRDTTPPARRTSPAISEVFSLRESGVDTRTL